MQETFRLGWRLALALLGAHATGSLVYSAADWMLCWKPDVYCGDVDTPVRGASVLAFMFAEALRDLVTLTGITRLTIYFAIIAGLIYSTRHKLMHLMPVQRALTLVSLGGVVAVATSLVWRGYTSNWERYDIVRYDSDRSYLLAHVATLAVASLLAWWAIKIGTWSNYAMQRSSRVGTPLAGTGRGEDELRSASGAPTARRR